MESPKWFRYWGSIDWMQLLKLASEHDIKDLTWFAVKTISELSSRLSIDDKMEWLGNIRITETGNQEMFELTIEYAEFITTPNQMKQVFTHHCTERY